MAYKLKYYSNFNSKSSTFRVEIYIDSDNTVSAEELLLTDDAVIIEYKSDDIFQPLKCSGCTINILTSSILEDLYTGTMTDVMVKILKGNNLHWYGYLTPNVYSSEYNDNCNLLSINCIDVISQLNNIKYQSTTDTIRSFYTVLVEALSKIDSGHIINNIYLHKVLSMDNSYDMLNNLYVHERNFYDEESEPQTYREIIEELLRYMGMTLIQFGDSFYILDYQSLKNNTSFIKYNITTALYSEVTISSDYRLISNIGVIDANCTVSLGDVYNKINVIENTLSNKKAIPGIYDDLVNQNADQSKYYSLDDVYEATWSNHWMRTSDYSYYVAYFNSNKWNTQPTKQNSTVITEMIPNGLMPYEGTYFQKMARYLRENGTPSTINFTDYITQTSAIMNKGRKSFWLTQNDVIFRGGYFILDLAFIASHEEWPLCDATQTHDGKKSLAFPYVEQTFSKDYEDFKFPVQLKIGDYYYNGEDWTTTESKFYITRKNHVGDKIYMTEYHVDNKVEFTANLIDSGDGVLIPLPPFTIYGNLTLTVFEMTRLGSYVNDLKNKFLDMNSNIQYVHITTFKFWYTRASDKVDIFNNNNTEDDILISNVINDKYIKEMDDIKLKVNTFSEKAGSYSYVLRKTNDNKFDFVDKIQKGINSASMESHILDMYYQHYSTAKFVYNNSLNNKNLMPYTIIKSQSLNKDMIIDSVTLSLADDKAEVTLKEV